MAAEQDTDPYCTPVRHDHQRNHRSLCTPPRKPSAKHGRNVADAPDTNVITKRTSRRVRRALAFTGIATPPLSAKSRAAILSALRGRGASMRLDFDAVCPDAVGDPAGQPYMQDCGVDDAKVGDAKVGEGKVGDGKVGDGKVGDGKVPAGSVTPPPVMVCWRCPSHFFGCQGSARHVLHHRPQGTSDASLHWHKTATPIYQTLYPRSKYHCRPSQQGLHNKTPPPQQQQHPGHPPRPPSLVWQPVPQHWLASPIPTAAYVGCGVEKLCDTVATSLCTITNKQRFSKLIVSHMIVLILSW